MKKLIVALAGISAIAIASPASATAVIGVGTVNAIPAGAPPSGNDFVTQLGLLGLVNYTGTGATLALNAPATLTFDFLGSESGYDDTFNAVGAVLFGNTETSGFEDHFASPVPIGAGVYGAGTLAGLLSFSSNFGAPAGVGSNGFGIFLPAGYGTGSTYMTNVFYLGYDDFGAGPDDNHDDYIVRVTLGDAPPVPEPATWAMMLLGFGAMGVAVRRSRKSTAIRQLA